MNASNSDCRSRGPGLLHDSVTGTPQERQAVMDDSGPRTCRPKAFLAHDQKPASPRQGLYPTCPSLPSLHLCFSLAVLATGHMSMWSQLWVPPSGATPLRFASNVSSMICGQASSALHQQLLQAE